MKNRACICLLIGLERVLFIQACLQCVKGPHEPNAGSHRDDGHEGVDLAGLEQNESNYCQRQDRHHPARAEKHAGPEQPFMPLIVTEN